MGDSPLAAACHRPFSNGTEGEAWMYAWCDLCAKTDGGGCDLMLHAFMPDEFPWHEAWLPEPDDGPGSLPSRMVCLAFEPCAAGDPGAEERAQRIVEVTDYWRTRR